MTALATAIVFAAFEYLVATAIGLPSTAAVVIAANVGLLAALLVTLGGAPRAGRGLGRSWY